MYRKICLVCLDDFDATKNKLKRNLVEDNKVDCQLILSLGISRLLDFFTSCMRWRKNTNMVTEKSRDF